MSIDLPRFINIRSHEMIKTIIKAMYSAFLSIVLISIILAGLTTYTFISQPSKSSQIIKVIQDMYSNQKSVLFDVIDLSKILIKDSNQSNLSEMNNPFVKTQSLKGLEDESELEESQLDGLLINEDKGDNPLGIVIEPTLPEVNENISPEIIEEQLVNEQNDFSMHGMDMDLNS